MSLTTPCDFAKARYLDMKVLKRLWYYLIFFLGLAVVLFLVVSIVLFMAAFTITAAVSGVGTLLTGGVATWLSTQVTNVTAEERKAFEELVSACTPPGTVGFAPASVAIKNQEWFRKLEETATRSVFSSSAARGFMADLRHEQGG